MERPSLVRLAAWAQRYGGFQVVTVRIDPESSNRDQNALGAQAVQLCDVDDVFARFGGKRVPATLVFGGQGTLVHAGAALDAGALRALKEIL